MFGQSQKQPEPIKPRDTLFGDQPLHYWASIDSDEEPWTLFKKAKEHVSHSRYNEAIQILKEITTMPGVESRHYLQACYFLSKLSSAPDFGLKIYGAVVEVGMAEGNDIVAIYADGSARYYNYTGKSILWDQPDTVIGNKIEEILQLSINVVSKIAPWKDARPAPPAIGKARINFLTSHGLHFGEAPQAALFNDPMAGGIMYGMLFIMETLIDRTLAASTK